MSDIEDDKSLPRVPFWRHLLAMVYDLFLIIPLLMVTSAVLVAIHGPTETAAGKDSPSLAAMESCVPGPYWLLRHVLAAKRTDAGYASVAR